MRFDFSERDQAIRAILDVLLELGPVTPDVLIDTTATRVSVAKSAVFGGWQHLYEERILSWGHDGKVRMTTEEAAGSAYSKARDAMLEYFMQENVAPISPVELARILSDGTGVDKAIVRRVMYGRLQSGQLKYDSNGKVRPGALLRRVAINA